MYRILKYCFLALICFLAYLTIDLYLTFKELTTNKTINIPTNTSTNLTIKSAEPYIRYNGIGITLNGLIEKNKNFQIEHADPLYIKYDVFSSSLTASYQGNSILTYKGKKYNAYIDIIYVVNFDFNFSTLSNIISDIESSIKHIESFEVKQNHIQIKDSDDRVIFDSKNSEALIKADFSNISSLVELRVNPPKKYNIKTNIHISKTNLETRNLPISILYGYVTNMDFDGVLKFKLNSKANIFKPSNPLDKSIIDFKCKKCKSTILDIDIDSKLDFSNTNKNIDINSKIKLNPDFKKYFPKFFEDAVTKLSKYNKNSKYYSHRIKNTLPVLDYSQEYSFILNSSHEINKDKVNLQLGNLIFVSSSNSGVLMTGDLKMNNTFDIKLNSELVFKNAENVVDYFTDYFQRLITKSNSIDQDKLLITKKTNYGFLKRVSDFPKSKSNDLKFTINIDSLDNKYLIGSSTKKDILNEYFASKTETIINKAIEKINPEKFIQKIAPEAQQELKKLLPKKTKISNKLWKKLLN